MTPRAVLSFVILALLALGAAFALGWQQHGVRYDGALRSAERRSDSLANALAVQVATVVHDTVQRDSIVTRWRRYVDTLPGTVDTLRGRVDTVTVPAVIRVADGVITELESQNRRCVSVLMTCQETATAAVRRAEQSEARAALVENAARAARKHVTAERAVCAVSAITNVLQWRFAK